MEKQNGKSSNNKSWKKLDENIDLEKKVELLKKASGDLDEFITCCFELYRPLIKSYIRKKLELNFKDEETAEDITQETFLNLVRHLKGPSRDYIDYPKRYILRIADNACSDYLRLKGHHLATNNFQDEELESLEDNYSGEGMLSLELKAAISALPEKEKKIVILSYFYGYSNKEIADKLDRHAVTIGTNLKKALARLRKELEETEVALTF